MNKIIQEKIDQYKKLAQSQVSTGKPAERGSRVDGLAQVIRSKKDADNFMTELKGVIKQAK